MPEHPDGHKYEYNCCPAPNVIDDECETCGYKWDKWEDNES